MKHLFVNIIITTISVLLSGVSALETESNPVFVEHLADVVISVHFVNGEAKYSCSGLTIPTNKIKRTVENLKKRSGKTHDFTYAIRVENDVPVDDFFKLFNIFYSYNDGRIYMTTLDDAVLLEKAEPKVKRIPPLLLE